MACRFTTSQSWPLQDPTEWSTLTSSRLRSQSATRTGASASTREMDDVADEVVQTRSEFAAAGGTEVRLEGARLTPQEARRLALGGSETQRAQLAADSHSLPADVAWILVNDVEEVAVSALDNMELPTEMLMHLSHRFADRAEIRAGVAAHPRAPIAQKLSQPVHQLSGASISQFLADVHADDQERAAFAALVRSEPKVILEEAWATIRS